MSATKHTPGPWAIHDAVATNVLGGLGYRIARCDFDEPSPCAESVANARLIAAAPRLLEACKRLVWLETTQGVTEDDFTAAMEACEDAIAQAEGGGK